MAAGDYNFDFMGYRKIAALISLVLVLLAAGSLAINQVNWGLDFTGGTLVEVYYDNSVSPEAIRVQLDEAGYKGHVVQYFGSDQDVLVRIPPQKTLSDKENATLGDHVIDSLKENAVDNKVTLRRSEFVGPAVGEELTNQGGLGLLAALAVVLIYVAFRFQLKFAVGAVVALFHDVMITLGIFSLARWDFDLTVLAALLAVIGYSLNDTIVVSDRIRENFRKIRRSTPVDIINKSLNQTLGRTLITSFTTLIVLFALLLLGGELIRGFAIGLIIGVMVGTYSSIYIAANVLLMLDITKEDLAIPVKEGADDQDIPQGF
jgi:preprotein translocase subunit SecF